MPLNNLKTLNLSRHYDPAFDGSDLIEDFYIPCLSVSNRYDRISAYFSAALLKSFSNGLQQFYENNGHIRFIFSCQLAPDEMSNITSGYVERMELMAGHLAENEDLIKNDYQVSNLSFLIKNNLADVKIAFMLKDEASICHIKAGLFEDKDQNKIYFEGSGNETIFGTMKNAENYTISNNFSSPEQLNDVNYGEEKFNKIRNNTYSPSTVRTEFPVGKLFNKLISFSRGKIFKTQEELYCFENCVVIDINKLINAFILSDYTKEKYLSNYMILQTKFEKDWVKESENEYLLTKISVHILRDIIISTLNKFGIKYLLTPDAQAFLNDNNLNMEKRIKLGASIKENKNKELWYDDFLKFKEIVNDEMVGRLKDKQLINSYFHYKMVASADYSVPGTGKTYISYGLFAFLSSSKIKIADKLVVFGPLNCFKAWIDEQKVIFGDKKQFSIFDIRKHKSDYKNVLEKQKFDIYIFNYDFLGNDNENVKNKIKILNKYVLNSKTLLVFDEIHKLKSLTGITSRNFVKMLEISNDKPLYRMVLTGTPLPNSFADVLNYMKILYPNDIYDTFSNINENKLKLANNNKRIADEVINTLLPTFVRTTKKDLNVPAPDLDDFDTLCVAPSDKEKQLYELIWKDKGNSLVKYIRLIQASSNPALLQKNINFDDLKNLYDEDDEALKFGYESEQSIYSEEKAKLIKEIGISSKMTATIKKIEEMVKDGKKILVWCLFVDSIEFVKQCLKSKNIDCDSIYGIDDLDVREKKIERFKTGNSMVLITNPNTLAESISLHMVCHDAIYLEYGFNLTYMLQSKDRINRVGLSQDTHTHYYYAITRKNIFGFGSIDELILERLNVKAARMLDAIESNRLSIINDGSSEIDDIKFILKKGSLKS